LALCFSWFTSSQDVGLRRSEASNFQWRKVVERTGQINGTATDRGQATIETETKTKFETKHGDAKETHTKSEVSGDLAGMPFLGGKSVKMIEAPCP